MEEDDDEEKSMLMEAKEDSPSSMKLPSTELTGVEDFVVGLSPGYWSHIPLSIADVNNVKVVDGINCIVRGKSNGNKCIPSIQCFPISKCTLVGIVVDAQEKANNSYFYVLDDGTGFIDCLVWGQGEDNVYALPFLDVDTKIKESNYGIGVGDMVRVLGRLECVSVSETAQHLPIAKTNSATTLELRDCIHELHVNKIEKLRPDTRKNYNDLDWEANHWVKSMLATKPAKDSGSPGLRHPAHVLEWLGPTIRSDVHHRRHFPSAANAAGEWRVFGVSCHCDLFYKEALLYCHCQAKAEPLDPKFVYRDNLLRVLLDLEEQHHKAMSGSSSRNVPMDFRFQYYTVSNHKELRQVAARVTRATEDWQVKQLIVATFRSLRQDGILYLLDENTDTYLLISRKGVLEPYLKRSRGRKPKRNQLPSYLQNVPRARLRYLQVCDEGSK